MVIRCQKDIHERNQEGNLNNFLKQSKDKHFQGSMQCQHILTGKNMQSKT